MPTIVQFIGILLFALDDRAVEIRKEEMERRPEGRLCCVIHRRTSVLGLRSWKVRAVLEVVLQYPCRERGAQG